MFGRPILPPWVAHKIRQLFPDRGAIRAAYDQRLRERRGQTVYDFVTYLAERYQCYRIIDVGASHVASLMRRLEDYVPIPGVESLWHPEHYSLASHRTHNFERRAFRHSDRLDLKDALIVCAGVIGRMRNSQHLLASLLEMLKQARLAVVTSDLHTSAEFRIMLETAGLEILFHGRVPATGVGQEKNSILCVVRKPSPPLRTPENFRVIALVGAYNEEDVIVPLIEHMVAQGVEVCLLDNWSTDQTAARASRYLNRGVASILKFPASGPIQTHEWRGMLKKKAELSKELEADWFIHLDPDEIRESPWPGVTIRDALYRADQEGFNAVDHTILVFHPTGGGYNEDRAIQDQFSHFEFGAHHPDFVQVKAWKRQSIPVDCATSGGHEITFQGRRVYPFKFLLRHYPIRSQEHGEKKVFKDRLPRFSPELRKIGWHVQYDSFEPGYSFLHDPEALLRYDPSDFAERYLLERISGVGIKRLAHASVEPEPA